MTKTYRVVGVAPIEVDGRVCLPGSTFTTAADVTFFTLIGAIADVEPAPAVEADDADSPAAAEGVD